MCLLFKKQMKLSEAGKESFIVAKLSETAERAEQVLAKMQVALGFVMALMAALLAVIAAIFQAICSNSFLPPPKEIIDFWNYCEMLSVPANSILWAMAGLTATIGCISNLIALAIQLTAANFYISLVKEHNEVVGSIADTNGLSEKYGSIIELPELPKRIKKGSIKRIGNVKKCAVGKHPKSEKLGSTGQAACCARIHSRYFTGGNPSGLRV